MAAGAYSVRARYERDEDLAAALASLAPDAWRQLVDEQYDAVYHYAQLRTDSQIAAGEIASSVFARATAAAEKFHPARAPSIGRMLDLTDRAIPQPSGKRAKASRGGGLSRDALRQAIGRLGANDRDVLVLRLVEGHDVDVTARLLRSSPGKIRSRQMHALQQLSREHGGFAPDRTSGLESTLDACIDGLTRGDPLEDVLSVQHGRTLELLPMLRVAYGVVRLPRDPPSPDARSNALASMMREIEVARFQNTRQVRVREERRARTDRSLHLPSLRFPAVHVPTAHRERTLSRRRPAAAIAVSAIMLIGAATAAVIATRASSGWNSGLLGPSDLPSAVLVEGNFVAENHGALWMVSGSELRRVEMTPTTAVFRGDVRGTLAGVDRTARVEVVGTVRLDGTLIAAMVRARV